jgi:hypothetical protein
VGVGMYEKYEIRKMNFFFGLDNFSPKSIENTTKMTLGYINNYDRGSKTTVGRGGQNSENQQENELLNEIILYQCQALVSEKNHDLLL